MKKIPEESKASGTDTGSVQKKRGRPKGSVDKSQRKQRSDRLTTVPGDGDNSHILRYSLALSRLPKIDVNDLQQVTDRINTFFSVCDHSNCGITSYLRK